MMSMHPKGNSILLQITVHKKSGLKKTASNRPKTESGLRLK